MLVEQHQPSRELEISYLYLSFVNMCHANHVMCDLCRCDITA